MDNWKIKIRVFCTSVDIDFRFQLNKDELNFVMSKKSTSPKNLFSGQNGGTRKLPYAFTEQGIYMLMTVLYNKDLVI